jgi:hypothetical protein
MGSSSDQVKPKTIKLIFAKHAALRRKSKDWLKKVYNKGNTKRGVSPRLKIRPCDLDL